MIEIFLNRRTLKTKNDSTQSNGGEHLIQKIQQLPFHNLKSEIHEKMWEVKFCYRSMHKNRGHLNYSFSIWYKTRQIKCNMGEHFIYKIHLLPIYNLPIYIAKKIWKSCNILLHFYVKNSGHLIKKRSIYPSTNLLAIIFPKICNLLKIH